MTLYFRFECQIDKKILNVTQFILKYYENDSSRITELYLIPYRRKRYIFQKLITQFY